MSGFIYAIHAVGTNRVKIGFSVKPEERLVELQTGSPFALALIATCPGSQRLEGELHSRLKHRHCMNEWFELTPSEAKRFLENVQEEEKRFTIYDVPGANLDARGEAYMLLKHADDPEAVRASAERIIDLLSRSIRAMGRDDVSVLQVVENKEEVA